jgi:ubiquinone/menaquinone biosynthesis C-methylase UbiE
MDAERLCFEDDSFDTVAISASLRHLSHIQRVLDEMVRVLKPGGHFIAAEMHRDGQTEAELTSVYLHQWVAQVDTARATAALRFHHDMHPGKKGRTPLPPH